jgi:hypothetical protein
MKKAYLIFLMLINSPALANTNAESCLDLEINVIDHKTIQNVDFVNEIEDSIDFNGISQKFGRENLVVEESKNIHDGNINYLYVFGEGSNLVAFVLGPKKESGKVILSCACIESRKFDSKEIYIGQPYSYYQSKFGINEEFEKLTIERGETLVELFFSKSALYKYRFRNLGYNG